MDYGDITNWSYDNQKQEIVFCNTTKSIIKNISNTKSADLMKCLQERYNTTDYYLLALRMNNDINSQRVLKQQFLEKGLIIGRITTILEKDKQINFTCNMAYDTDFLELANNLIREFYNSNEKYFTEFVEYRLKEMQTEIKKENR